MQNYFADNSSCTVEIYNDTGMILASDCNYTWGNGMYESFKQF